MKYNDQLFVQMLFTLSVNHCVCFSFQTISVWRFNQLMPVIHLFQQKQPAPIKSFELHICIHIHKQNIYIGFSYNLSPYISIYYVCNFNVYTSLKINKWDDAISILASRIVVHLEAINHTSWIIIIWTEIVLRHFFPNRIFIFDFLLFIEIKWNCNGYERPSIVFYNDSYFDINIHRTYQPRSYSGVISYSIFLKINLSFLSNEKSC